MHRARNLLVTLITVACLSSSAQASPLAKLHVSFIPEHLGQSTTLEFNAQIGTSTGDVPPPLTELEVRYPSVIGLAVGELGLATCSVRKLEIFGLAGCPANSRMGEGSALAEIPIGPETLQEVGHVAIFRAPERNGHLTMLFFATGESPVSAQIPFSGTLLSAPPPYGARILIKVPLVPSLPEAPNVSVVQIHATIGPLGLTYYEHIHGKVIAYKPRGILLPRTCPPGGFRFQASFTFLDSSNATARTSVPCPRHA